MSLKRGNNMPKVQVTIDLAETIKSMRYNRGISAKDIANKINYSQSYLSKLESASVKYIDFELLCDIFSYIIGNKEDYDTLVDELYKTLKFKYTNDEIKNFIWFNNFDTVYRRIPIQEPLVEFICSQLKNLDISIEMLVIRINNNECIPNTITNLEKYPFNLWFNTKKSDGEFHPYIKLRTSNETVERILNKSVTTSNYVLIQAIIFYLLKIEKYKSVIDISLDNQNELLEQAVKILNCYKFYSLTERSDLLEQATCEEDRSKILTVHEKENEQAIKNMIDFIHLYSDYNIIDANNQISIFTKNLAWDAPFVMRIVSYNFFEQMKDMGYADKMKVWSDFGKFLDEYFKKNS